MKSLKDTILEFKVNEERAGSVIRYAGHVLRISTFFMNIDEDKQFIKNNLNLIWNILQEGYAPLGGFKGIQYKSELIKKASLVKLGFYDDEIVAVMVCNDYLGGDKAVGLTCVRDDRHELGVVLVKMIIDENINKWDDFIWAEVSGRIEDFYEELNGFKVKTKYLNIYLNDVPFKPLNKDDYHYIRTIQGKPEKKIIYGIKNISAIKRMMEDDFETLRNFLKDKENGFSINEDAASKYYRELSSIEQAKIIVDSFINFKENYFYNEFPEDLYKELENNVNYIENEIKSNNCPADLLRNMKECVKIGNKVLKTSTIFKPFRIKDKITYIDFKKI